MTPSPERDMNVFGEQPNHAEMHPQITDLLAQFGNRVEWLTARTLSPAERAIVDARLLKLEMQFGMLETDHKQFITTSMFGEEAVNDDRFTLAA